MSKLLPGIARGIAGAPCAAALCGSSMFFKVSKWCSAAAVRLPKNQKITAIA